MTALASLAPVLWWIGLCLAILTLLGAFVWWVELMTQEPDDTSPWGDVIELPHELRTGRRNLAGGGSHSKASPSDTHNLTLAHGTSLTHSEGVL